MRRTLFLIPHEVAGIPVFGVGWLLFGLAAFVLVRLAWVTFSDNAGTSITAALKQEFGMWATFAAIIVFALPRAELANVTGDPVGMPIRGYGMFLMLAAIGSVSIAAWRADRAGLGSEMILRLAPYTFIGGFLGARLFYVIQYRADFMRETWSETLLAMAAFTQGGLVVYGGFIGGFFASVWAIRRFQGSLWKFGDVIIPCVFVGLFFGRLGCLMNGCCYGGECQPNPLSVQFPPGSKVYADQLTSGDLIGIESQVVDQPANDQTPGRISRRIESIHPGSIADQAGLEPGQSVELIVDPSYLNQAPPDVPAEDALPGLAIVRDGELIARVGPDELPPVANPVVATQVISSVLAAIMFVVLLILERWVQRRPWYRDGLLMLVGFIGYALIRIVLEWVRVDEAGQFGTSLSISQWVSLAVITASLIAMAGRCRGRVDESPAM
ncbi:prolipoprotein diacylglyceryl transferase [Neorhodopirellula pilleata]|uniref:Phosphatidylglycerol--prolipoprotein diacylglyceryl transferase n=1 Tax=Neorhodopirellula pilleata TaxID=2714738 RepID=A0A5C5ZZL5_9BACT|nr:prolipoprotein diacylglyceryl transferase family protein [Neorhodopirellula pilleata]TWT93012.1 Prolipoprotein diacylglyceryl transferase [Neorhodopirellula pilleata]